MKLLFVCSGGMSSQIVVDALQAEAKKEAMELDVCAIGSNGFEEKIKEGFDAAMVAPQIRHRYKELKQMADEAGVPCDLIEPFNYSPLGSKKLLLQLKKLINL